MHPLIALCRDVIRGKLAGAHPPLPTLDAPWDAPRPVFVTLYKGGKLRGCIGSLQATRDTLADEVAWAARAAAFRDPRFPPVSEDELDDLTYEISVLEPAEPVTDIGTLDPDRYGVIVQSGHRRGVLLPAIDSVRTVEDQLHIARRKAGIREHDPVAVSRFEVTRIDE